MSGKDREQATSIRALARVVGRSPSAVRKWIPREDWPFGLVPPWDVEHVKAWMEIHLKADPAAAYRKRAKAAEDGRGEFSKLGPMGKAKLQYQIERTLLVHQRRLIEAGKLHNVEQCQQRSLRQIHEVRSALMAMGRSLANSLVGEDAETIEGVINDRCEQICEEFASAGDAD